MKPRTNYTYLMRGLTDTTTERISFFAQLCPLVHFFLLYLVFLSCPPSLLQQLYRCFIADGPEGRRIYPEDGGRYWRCEGTWLEVGPLLFATQGRDCLLESRETRYIYDDSDAFG